MKNFVKNLSAFGVLPLLASLLVSSVFYAFMVGDTLIIFNATEQLLQIRSIKLDNELLRDSEHTFPVHLAIPSPANLPSEALWFSHNSLSKEVVMSIETMGSNSDATKNSSCKYQRLARWHCTAEIWVTNDELICKPCTADL
jgi:hypothetical protein